MKATLVWLVDKRQRKDGTYPLRWRLQYNGERRYYQSNTTITPKDIDKNFNVTNWDIEGRLHEDLRIFRRRIQELHLDVNMLDMDFVFAKVFGTVNPDHLEFISWAREWVRKEAVGNPSLSNRYGTAVNALAKYKGECIPVHEMTTKMMKGFQTYLEKSGGKRTPSLYTMCIKALFGRMRDEFNDYDNDEIVIKNTMASYKPPKPPTPEKRGLSLEQMKLILATPEQTGIKLRDMARDVFVMSFHLLGTNAVDLWQLKRWEGCNAAENGDESAKATAIMPTKCRNREGCKNGYIAYERQKTRLRRDDKAYIEIDVPDEIMPLMNRYRSKGGKYVFRFHSTYKCNCNFNRALNDGLKILAAEINGIDYVKLYYKSVYERTPLKKLLEEEYHHVRTEKVPRDLDFYTARHTMATIAANDCLIDECTVDRMLNHSSQMIAKKYIKDNFRPINVANRKLLDYVHGKTESETFGNGGCKTIAM